VRVCACEGVCVRENIIIKGVRMDSTGFKGKGL